MNREELEKLLETIPEEGKDFKDRPYKKRELGKSENLFGIKNNLLTALCKITAIGRKGSYWLCVCDCGNLAIIPSSAFKGGTQKSCGCLHNIISANQRFTDLTGQTFGDLYVKSRNYEYAEEKKKTTSESRAYWNCVCKCGREVIRSTHNLTCKTHPTCNHCFRQIDYSGYRNGKLVALYSVGKNNRNSMIWHCKCDCGKEIDISSECIKTTISCGCLNQSKGEYYIDQLLKKHNINFLYNRPYFSDLKSTKNATMRYDFILLNENNEPYRLIEFDGEQHYIIKEDAELYNGIYTQENDNIKNEYAKTHNLPLVRIPYWKRENITFEMLMGDEYLVT